MANSWYKKAVWGLVFLALSFLAIFVFLPPYKSYEYLYGTVEQVGESVYHKSTEEYPEFFSEKVVYENVMVELDNGDSISILDDNSKVYLTGDTVKVKKTTVKRLWIVEDIVYELAE